MNNNGRIDADENFYGTRDQLSKAIAAGKYPSPPARDLYFVAHGNPKNPIVVAFLRYVLTKGQRLVGPQGYIGINKDILDKELKSLRK